MSRTLEVVTMDEATDWSGQILPREMAKHLMVGCIVRIMVRNSARESWEKLYCEITKIKDGTFWGTVQDTYRMGDYIGLETGETMTFRREQINEIPLDWQPKRYQKAIAHLELK